MDMQLCVDGAGRTCIKVGWPLCMEALDTSTKRTRGNLKVPEHLIHLKNE